MSVYAPNVSRRDLAVRWFLASIALVALSFGVALPSASPDEQSLLQQQITPQIGTDHIPGAVAGIMRDGNVTLEAFGVRDQRGTPMTQDARFAIGSLTKQFTAVAVLMLAKERRLSLDDRLARYFPALPNAKTITIRMLLNQTSGLHNYPKTTEHTWPLYGTIDPTRLFAIFAQDKPDFAPGTKWEYSNTNYAILAGIVAMASGVPYGEFLQQRIFGPLGMTSS
ncbi:MAG TPA: serine hydrolase domain-containing protein, partial [Candidatus Tumulicola sp.]|nr:serine hydrolase domain-containing protein [Candidatus Tumulicola sp.]